LEKENNVEEVPQQTGTGKIEGRKCFAVQILTLKKIERRLSNKNKDSRRVVDPDPYSESGSGSRRAKMTHKSRQKFVKVHVLKCWMASFES
jgi:hypothetical protein